MKTLNLKTGQILLFRINTKFSDYLVGPLHQNIDDIEDLIFPCILCMWFKLSGTQSVISHSCLKILFYQTHFPKHFTKCDGMQQRKYNTVQKPYMTL